MKITKHIAFFYNKERLQYLNQQIQAANDYPFYTDIYIHTNQFFSEKSLSDRTNGFTYIIVHDLTDKDPLTLPQLTKPLLKSQKDQYDIFIYTEDDILIPPAAIKYWLDNKDPLLKENFNLGFIRIEVDSLKEEFACDLNNEHCICQQLFEGCKINDKHYIVNDVNTYTAFWIYDKLELNRFINSKWWDSTHIKGYHTREAVAIGLHFIRDPENKWYNNTVIPLTQDMKLVDTCKVYHLPNNYVNEPYCFFATVRFDEIIPLTQEQVINPNFVLERKHSRLIRK
jgi:hypothetical protein